MGAHQMQWWCLDAFRSGVLTLSESNVATEILQFQFRNNLIILSIVLDCDFWLPCSMMKGYFLWCDLRSSFLGTLLRLLQRHWLACWGQTIISRYLKGWWQYLHTKMPITSHQPTHPAQSRCELLRNSYLSLQKVPLTGYPLRGVDN